MKRAMSCGLVLIFVLAGPSLSSAQEQVCKLLDRGASRLFVPDKIPMETELLTVDSKNVAAIQFTDKSRMAIAALATSGLSAEIRQRYQYVIITEARLFLGPASISAGMVGFGIEATDKNAATCTLVARDVSGREIERFTLQQDPEAKNSSVSLTPKGAKEFELHIGKYIVQGAQR